MVKGYQPYKSEVDFVRATSGEITAFGVLALVNFISLSALVLTHLWTRNVAGIPQLIRKLFLRDKAGSFPHYNLWLDASAINLLIIAVVATSPWGLLYLDTDVAYGTKDPAYWICLVQGSFVLVWAVFFSAGALCVIVKMWPRITFLNSQLLPYRNPPWLDILILSYPWLLFIGFGFGALTVGVLHPEDIVMRELYCAIEARSLQQAALGVTIFNLLLLLGLEIHMLVFITRHLSLPDNSTTAPSIEDRTTSASSSHKAINPKQGLRIGGLKIEVIIRPMIFGVVAILSFGMVCITLKYVRAQPWSKLVLCIIPTMTFIAYASETELLELWGVTRLFRRRRAAPPPELPRGENTDHFGIERMEWPASILKSSSTDIVYTTEIIEEKKVLDEEIAVGETQPPQVQPCQVQALPYKDTIKVHTIIVEDQQSPGSVPSSPKIEAGETLYQRGLLEWKGRLQASPGQIQPLPTRPFHSAQDRRISM